MADADNTLILETTQGPVTIEMRPDLAPGHVAQIKNLVRKGFYDGIVFHRVIDGFMAQTGCPEGTGTGGSGNKLKAESPLDMVQLICGGTGCLVYKMLKDVIDNNATY